MEAAARPLPSEDTTPPVTKMYFADMSATSLFVFEICAWWARLSIAGVGRWRQMERFPGGVEILISGNLQCLSGKISACVRYCSVQRRRWGACRESLRPVLSAILMFVLSREGCGEAAGSWQERQGGWGRRRGCCELRRSWAGGWGGERRPQSILLQGCAGSARLCFICGRRDMRWWRGDGGVAKLRGDVDLIGWDGDWLCFVEVKTRTGRDEMSPAESAVDGDKQEMLRKMARVYLRSFPEKLRRGVPVRFDIVSVYLAAGRG